MSILINRRSYANLGKQVNSIEQACAAIPFSIETGSVSRSTNGVEIPNTKALFRSDNGNCLGIHSEQFEFSQPCETLEKFEILRDFVGAKWCSATAYKGGRQIMSGAVLDLEIEAPKRGDKIAFEIVMRDYFDGTGHFTVSLNVLTLACLNGMMTTENLAGAKIKHVGVSYHAKNDVWLKQFQANLALEIGKTKEIVFSLDNTLMTREEVVSFAEKLFPSRGEEVSTRTENMREAIVTGFSRGTGNVGQTRWDAFNSVTEFVDWQSTFRETEFSRDENRMESVFGGNGARLRERALNLLLN